MLPVSCCAVTGTLVDGTPAPTPLPTRQVLAAHHRTAHSVGLKPWEGARVLLPLLLLPTSSCCMCFELCQLLCAGGTRQLLCHLIMVLRVLPSSQDENGMP